MKTARRGVGSCHFLRLVLMVGTKPLRQVFRAGPGPYRPNDNDLGRWLHPVAKQDATCLKWRHPAGFRLHEVFRGDIEPRYSFFLPGHTVQSGALVSENACTVGAINVPLESRSEIIWTSHSTRCRSSVSTQRVATATRTPFMAT